MNPKSNKSNRKTTIRQAAKQWVNLLFIDIQNRKNNVTNSRSEPIGLTSPQN